MNSVRGIILLIKEWGGSISISELADEAEEEVDDLLPLLNACKLLDFINVDDAIVKLTEKGEKLTKGSPYKVIREGLKEVEPFKSALEGLSKKTKTTSELLKFLKSKGIIIREEAETKDSLKRILRNWGVGSKLLHYNEDHDTWSIRALL